MDEHLHVCRVAHMIYRHELMGFVVKRVLVPEDAMVIGDRPLSFGRQLRDVPHMLA